MAVTETHTTQELTEQAVDHLWLQFTDTQRVQEQGLRVIAEASGVMVRDTDGREYIDGLGGLFTTQIGHGRQEVATAVAEQLATLDYFSLFGFATPPAIELAERLAEVTPGDLSVVNFTNSGSEAVEAALKIARQYHKVRGQGGRYKVISRLGAFHGVTMGALSATGVRIRREQFEPLVPGFIHVTPPDSYHYLPGSSEQECSDAAIRAIEEAIEFEGPDSIAAVIIDPVMAAIGVIVPPPDYLPRLRDICDRHGILLIIDEVLTGFGRTGRMFACEHWGVTPDIMTVAKGLSSGYQPLAAAIATEEVAETFQGKYFQHGQTFSGHPAACRAGLVSLDIIQREHLVENAAEVGAYLLRRLHELLEFPMIGDVRGKGLLLGIEIVQDKDSCAKYPADLEIGFQVRDRAIDLGLICRSDNDCIILAPPLILTTDQADRIVEILKQSLAEISPVQSGLH